MRRALRQESPPVYQVEQIAAYLFFNYRQAEQITVQHS
nr:MAG TPA: hypothetical protein [Inoviridae sp.]